MTMTLYWRAGSGSMVVEAALRMIGQPFTRVEVAAKSDQRQTAFLALNPTGRIPVLVLPEQQPVFETMAILLALDERHPQAALLPASGTAERATAVQWLAFLATQAYGSALRYWYPQRHTSDPAEAAIAAVKRQSAIDMRRDLGLYCAAMQGKFLLGDRLTITDVYAAMIGDWEEPAFTDARLAALREAVLGVDTVRAAWESHQFSR